LIKLFRDLIDLFRHPVSHWLVWREKSDERQKSKAERQRKYGELSELWKSPPSLPDEGYKEFLVEAYRKHSTELASIEDRLNKLVLIILGVFGAGATAISKAQLARGPAGVIIFLVAVFAYFGVHYVFEIHQVRAAVRYLLVRCEIEMGFYSLPRCGSKNIPADKQLYSEEELRFPTKGRFLRNTYAAVIILAASGLISLISVQTDWGGRHTKNPGAPASTFAPF